MSTADVPVGGWRCDASEAVAGPVSADILGASPTSTGASGAAGVAVAGGVPAGDVFSPSGGVVSACGCDAGVCILGGVASGVVVPAELAITFFLIRSWTMSSPRKGDGSRK
jgi:hypothetical protein